MSPQAYRLRPLRWRDLPTLKRWRSRPEVQKHLRHPIPPTWFQHLRWFWNLQTDPTARVWGVMLNGKLIGQAGWYNRRYGAAEVSVVVVIDGQEDFSLEAYVVETLLTQKARQLGLTVFWAEVLARAPLLRHTVFPSHPRSVITADGYSTIYRWSIL